MKRLLMTNMLRLMLVPLALVGLAACNGEQDFSDAVELIELGEGETARNVMARYMREAFSTRYGADLSGYSDSEVIDGIEYSLFPNMFLFPGVGLPMIYRFRPNGMDVDSAIFDLLFLRPLADDRERPEAPEPVKVSIAESYASVPGMVPGLGEIYDQDTNNLDMQQKGFKAGIAGGAKSAQTLGNYQEVRIRRLHMTLDQYLNA